MSHFLRLDCPRGAHRGQRQTALRCPGGLAAFKLCSFASRLTGDERTQSMATRSKAAIALPLSSDRVTDVWTHWHIGVWWKALLTHLKTPRRGYLFVGVRLLKLEQREEEGGRGHQWGSYLLVSHARSCGNGMFRPLLLSIAEALSVTQHFHAATHT